MKTISAFVFICVLNLARITSLTLVSPFSFFKPKAASAGIDERNIESLEQKQTDMYWKKQHQSLAQLQFLRKKQREWEQNRGPREDCPDIQAIKKTRFPQPLGVRLQRGGLFNDFMFSMD